MYAFLPFMCLTMHQCHKLIFFFLLQVLVVQLAAKKSGYADVVYLDAKTDTYLEEVSSCNIFVVKGNRIKTPPLQVRCAGCLSFISSHHCLLCAQWSNWHLPLEAAGTDGLLW